eukprot:TRINITY_DN5883_c0_g1_i5.p1 TRINITY_DN5883_c0_g1~~TRINITY_DN5883_c0_g1_i5.p1  ORF type:complete len:533 (+),score=120.88 TRINITY_DN5883_c0_g1_i5:53-1651(+)
MNAPVRALFIINSMVLTFIIYERLVTGPVRTVVVVHHGGPVGETVESKVSASTATPRAEDSTGSEEHHGGPVGETVESKGSHTGGASTGTPRAEDSTGSEEASVESKEGESHTGAVTPRAEDNTGSEEASGRDAAAPGSEIPTGRPVIVNYMSLHPSSKDTPPYCTAVFVYTALYAAANNLQYAYYTAPANPPEPEPAANLPEDCAGGNWCRHSEFKCHSLSCVGPNGCLLHPVWCKVKALRKALATYSTAPFALSLDTDAIIRYEDFRVDLKVWVGATLEKKGYPLEDKPLVANLEQPTWWCTLIQGKNNTMGVPYRWCANTGVLLVGNSERGRGGVDYWWGSALDSYDSDPLGFRFRKDWPWEQDRMMAILNEEGKGQFGNVQVLPNKDEFKQVEYHVAAREPGTCFSALGWHRCFIHHFCAGPDQKMYWGNRTMSFAVAMLQGCAAGHDIEMALPAGNDGAVEQNLTVTREGWCTDEVAKLGEGVDFAAMGNPESRTDFPTDGTAYAKRYEFLLKVAEVLAKRHVIELP